MFLFDRKKIYATSTYYTTKLLEGNKKTNIFDMNLFYLHSSLLIKNPTVYISLGRPWNISESEGNARILLSIESCLAVAYQQMVSLIYLQFIFVFL